MKKIYIYSLLIGILFSSCDVLELDPIDKLSETAVWNDAGLTEAYVNAAYHGIPQEYDQQMLSAASDEAYCIHNYGNLWAIQRGELTQDNISDMSWKVNFWKSAYDNIRITNIFFEKMEGSSIDTPLKNRMIGEMKFIRAFIYSNLIWRYGGVPIITKVYGLNDDYEVSRASYDECVDFIVNELNEAIELLPVEQSANQRGRTSGYACMALKSRLLLYAASIQNNSSNDKVKWQKAADSAEALLNVGFKLNDDYQQTFMGYNNEIIFARYWTQANTTDMHTWNGRNGSSGWGAQNPTQNLVDAYEMKTGIYDPADPYANRDPRFAASILYNGSVWAGRETETYKGGLDSSDSSVEAWNASMTGYYLKKFLPEAIPPSGSSEKPTNPFIFFRYAEILLNYAEAKFELGDEDTAREYLKKVRSRASVSMPDVTATGENLRKALWNERRVELVFEGHRFFDVRRWKIAMDTENEDLKAIRIEKVGEDSYTYEVYTLLERHFFEQHYLVPIARAEVDKSLGSLQQNPKY